MFSSVGNVLLLAFGFGFVIFWHELGHFLAAKWADVKVEQFAVGFGQALFSWRKGLGFRWGSTQAEYGAKVRAEVERASGEPVKLVPEPADAGSAGAATFGDLPTDAGPRVAGDPTDAQLDAAARSLGLSDTEYRLNWIPLGGYVKMLGQDDLRPGIDAPDPRSYTSKPVAKRMVIVSAGVIMNVILAAIGFVALFKIGYPVPPPIIGEVVPGSPASQAVRAVANGNGGKPEPAPLMAGDEIVTVDGRKQYSFDKIRLNTPLLIPGEAVPVEVRRAANGQVERVMVTPRRSAEDAQFPQLGIAPAQQLALSPGEKVDPARAAADAKLVQLPELTLINPGDAIVAVAGRPVQRTDVLVLTDAVARADGATVPVTVKHPDGTESTVVLPPVFERRFGEKAIEFAGLQMLPRVVFVSKDSLFAGLVEPGDVVVDVDTDASGGRHPMPTRDGVYEVAHAVQKSKGKGPFTLTVRRGGRTITTPPVKFDAKHPDTGMAFDDASSEPTTAQPAADSAAAAAGVPGGAKLVRVDGKPVANWFDVWRVLRQVPAGRGVPVVAAIEGAERTFDLRPLTADEVATIASNRLTTYAVQDLPPLMTIRKADGLVQAAEYGVSETRDAIVQVYLTLRSMVRGGISPKELSGPVGILAVGYKIAEAGSLKLLWFLSIISANLAVMNFLPIPVVDGGLFTFLLIEKLKGSPVSQRTQVIAQYVGLTLLLSVFVFATYQDIFRIPLLFPG